MPELVLASQSPRRRELMKFLGHPYRTTVPGIEESYRPGENPASHVTRLAEEKARDVGRQLDHAVVIGSDTVVVVDGDVLGKPGSPDDALAMLMRLQGRTHTVYTGFALYEAGTERVMSSFESTEVTMRPFSYTLARRYIATGEPMDKAGAYGIQGYGAVLIERVDGCYFTVMGLPMARLMAALAKFTGGVLGYFGTTDGATP